jgi:Fe-S oxidoreductase
MADHCELCGRGGAELRRHHLIPKTRRKNKKNKKLFSRTEVKERVLYVCKACHDTIHNELTEKELEIKYNTLESLLAVPVIARYVEWIKDKPINFKLPMNRSN